MSKSDSVILQAQGLSQVFQEGLLATPVLHDINFSLHAGERLAIVGASGSGKSTLLHLLAGLAQPSEGEVFLQGQAFASLSEAQRSQLRNQHLGFVYQFHYLLAELTALENVMLPLRIARVPAKQAQHKAQELLAAVGLAARADHKPSELSGGERQRVAIARALITEPACILADEPTGNLDSKSAEQVLALMLNLNEQFNTALLVVTHDLQLAKQLGNKIELVDGQIQRDNDANA
ncbi:ABC transporter ATP-binding protein [Thiomicrospira cyclica]|uniref:Phosphonate-transporting ATPase n=1 Tax=Thiomicrospira cyclica (strain DSM 14477 / JCM 11371 / ALM1) TaxID=717773 RepID=F6D8J3_THICA|nr:ABC transporter ATP-binding protein [Thiomicrospira cyclica]AEG31844.1 Phosphonate-transporting ATPase [Thiomicrospira cyclica ALM1]